MPIRLATISRLSPHPRRAGRAEIRRVSCPHNLVDRVNAMILRGFVPAAVQAPAFGRFPDP
ncbi:MAG: hypothetical protein ACKO01_04070 [Erythrobacter sp.]